MKHIDLEFFKELIAAIRLHFPDAIIAGGAVRDFYHSRPIKDIDVMTSYGVTKAGLLRLATEVGAKLLVDEPQDPSGDEEFEYELHFADGTPRLNIIDLTPFDFKDPVDSIHDFDFGLSQIAVTPNGLIMTHQFMRDSLRERIVYMHADNDGTPARASWRTESSAKRLQRLKLKYPEFAVRNCAGLERLTGDRL